MQLCMARTSEAQDERELHMTAIIFDLDGTLIHSTPDLTVAVNRMLAEESAQALDEATLQGFVGDGLHKLVERVISHAGLDAAKQDDLAARTLAHYNAVNGQNTVLYPGVLDCLHALRTQGFDQGICTNKPEAPARHVLTHFGLSEIFATVVGGDTLTQRKPAPAPLLHTIEALGASADETVYVGDSEVDEATARNASVPFALYTKGYRKKPINDFEAAFIFDHFDDLTTWLAGRA